MARLYLVRRYLLIPNPFLLPPFAATQMYAKPSRRIVRKDWVITGVANPDLVSKTIIHQFLCIDKMPD